MILLIFKGMFLYYLRSHAQEGEAIRLVEGESHDAVALLDEAVVARLLEVVGTNAVMGVGGKDRFSILSITHGLHPDALRKKKKY